MADDVRAVSAAIAVRFDVVRPLCQLADAAAAAFDAADIAAAGAEDRTARDEERALYEAFNVAGSAGITVNKQEMLETINENTLLAAGLRVCTEEGGAVLYDDVSVVAFEKKTT